MDHYSALGVSRSASQDEIRKAYKKLARENHPDARKDDAQAAERFRNIQDAYSVLGDPERRKLYDRFGDNWEAAQRAGASASGPGPRGGSPFTSRRGPSGSPGGGAQFDFDINDIFGGSAVDASDLFGFGRGAARQSRGRDIEATVRVPFKIAALGGTVDVYLDHLQPPETLGVKIPAGIGEGQLVRLAEKGQRGPAGHGDLLLKVQIESHPYFRRDGYDVLIDVPLTPAEAVLGAKVEVPTLEEGTVLVTIPAGTSSGTKLRLRGKGIVNPQTRQPGDQFVVTKIVVPREAPAGAVGLYQQLAAMDTNPRATLWNS